MAMTMAADDDDKEVDGDGATGDKVDDDGDAATGNEVDDDGDGATGIEVDDDGDGGSGTTGYDDDDYGDGRRVTTTTTTARRRRRRHTVNLFCICSSSGYQKGKIEDAVQELRQPPPIDHWHRNCLSLAIGLIMIFN